MRRVRLTIDVDRAIGEYLRSVPDAGAVVSSAVEEYRARALVKVLEAAYREDAAESARLNAEWESVEARIGG